MRRVILALSLAVVFMVVGVGTAFAHPNPGKGPHNENGNTTLDVYANEGFGGNLGVAIENWNEGNFSATAPIIKRVTSKSKADVWVHYNFPGQTGAAHQHFDNRVDEIHISTESPNPQWVLTHELGHSYSMQDLTHEECDAIAPDPETGRKSIMCHSRWEGGDITAHDREDLLLLPNQRITAAAIRHKTH